MRVIVVSALLFLGFLVLVWIVVSIFDPPNDDT